MCTETCTTVQHNSYPKLDADNARAVRATESTSVQLKAIKMFPVNRNATYQNGNRTGQCFRCSVVYPVTWQNSNLRKALYIYKELHLTILNNRTLGELSTQSQHIQRMQYAQCVQSAKLKRNETISLEFVVTHLLQKNSAVDRSAVYKVNLYYRIP